ncbi:MAG: peroxiredoxin [Victivallaceae bacterium]
MMSLVTQFAPDFVASAVMPDNSIRDDFRLAELRGKYVVLFFYPLDFTFVCPTELIAFDRAKAEFDALNTELVAVSIDSAYSHFAWRNMPRKEGGVGPLAYPMVADLAKSISRSYGVLKDESIALRGLFLIDREGIIRHELVNDLPLGRSVEETLRMVEALQFFEANGEVCPANWHKGDEAVKPTAKGIANYLAGQS